MRNILSKLTLTAALGLAITLTFSCSSDGGGGGGDPSSDSGTAISSSSDDGGGIGNSSSSVGGSSSSATGGDNAGTYIITKSGSTYTVTKGGTTVGTANQISTVINTAIRTDANGAACTIQFGTGGSNVLDIGTDDITFNSTWGVINLTGKITSSSPNNMIAFADSFSCPQINSTADIASTSASSLVRVINIKYGNTLTINGGTVSGAGGYTIYNNLGGTVTITGGTVSATGENGYAVYNANGTVTISPSATIIGNTSGVDGGTPSTYIITGSGTTFTAKKGETTVGTANQTIANVITAIQTDANGANCTIQFGDGTTALDIGTSGISFNNSGGTWGNITLSGKLKTDRSSYAVHITNGVTISSTAEIKNSGGTSIENSGTSIENYGTVNINGGTLSPVYNGGTLTIINGTITTTGTRYAIDNSGGTAIISGATISSTSSTNSAIRNNNGGTMTINSGTISSTTVSTIQNFSSLTIIGGTITSAVTTNSSSGTIVNQSVTGSTGILTITGGTVQNTAEGYAVNHMGGIYASGTVTITSPPTVIDKAKTTGNITWLP
jgi:hypothetical protein